MNYIAIKSTGDLLLDKIKVLNVVFKPLGYTFMKDEDTDKVLLIENNKNRVCLEENDYESSNGINRYIMNIFYLLIQVLLFPYYQVFLMLV